MIFNATNLNNVLGAFGMQKYGSVFNNGAKGAANITDFFEGGTFNRELFEKSESFSGLDTNSKKNLGDALDFGFGKNSKNYTNEALANAGEAYRRNGEIGLGTFATPTHSSSLLMETMGNNIAGAAFGGAAIGGITGAAMGNDSGESAVFGGLAGAAMFGMGRGLRSGAFMKQIEERAISSALGKNYDELYQNKQAVYGKDLEDISKKEAYNASIPQIAKEANEALLRKKNEDLPHAEYLQTRLDNHKRFYGDATEEQALASLEKPEIYGFDTMNRVVDESYQKEILADMASRGEDVSEFYNSNGSMKTLQQSLEEDLAKASKDYDENINLHEDPLIHDDYIKKVHDENYQNSIVRDQKGKEYLAKEKEKFIKSDKSLNKRKEEERKSIDTHLSNEKTQVEKIFDEDYKKFLSGTGYDSTYQDKYEIIKNNSGKGGNQKLANQAKNEIKSSMLKSRQGEYTSAVDAATIKYDNLEDFSKKLTEQEKTIENMYFYSDDQVHKNIQSEIQKLHKEYPDLQDDALLDRAKKIQVEDERKNFEGTQKLRELQNEQLQKQIDTEEEVFGWQKNLNDYNDLKNKMNTGVLEPTEKEIADKISARGLDKVDDEAYYNSIYPGRTPGNIDEMKKANKAHKEDLAIGEIRKERQAQFDQAQEEFRDRTSLGGDLQEVDYLGVDKYKEDYITNNPLRSQIEANKELTKKEGSFKSTFDKNKEAHLQPIKTQLEDVKKATEERKADFDKGQNIIKEDFKLAKESNQKITDLSDPTKHSELMDVLKKGGAPDEIFKKPDADPMAPASGYTVGDIGHVLNPHTFNPRQQELMNARAGGKIPEAFANKELLQEAVAAKPSSFMGKQAQKLLRSGPDHNIGMQTRHMVLGGSMLAGAAFGSKRKDHSRGFNSHRGNRI